VVDARRLPTACNVERRAPPRRRAGALPRGRAPRAQRPHGDKRTEAREASLVFIDAHDAHGRAFRVASRKEPECVLSAEFRKDPAVTVIDKQVTHRNKCLPGGEPG
jgi:hypothetical protein